MSVDNTTEENLITKIWDAAALTLTEATQMLCLCAILSTYLFAMLKPAGIQNSKALGDK